MRLRHVLVLEDVIGAQFFWWPLSEGRGGKRKQMAVHRFGSGPGISIATAWNRDAGQSPRVRAWTSEPLVGDRLLRHCCRPSVRRLRAGKSGRPMLAPSTFSSTRPKSSSRIGSSCHGSRTGAGFTANSAGGGGKPSEISRESCWSTRSSEYECIRQGRNVRILPCSYPWTIFRCSGDMV